MNENRRVVIARSLRFLASLLSLASVFSFPRIALHLDLKFPTTPKSQSNYPPNLQTEENDDLGTKYHQRPVIDFCLIDQTTILYPPYPPALRYLIYLRINQLLRHPNRHVLILTRRLKTCIYSVTSRNQRRIRFITTDRYAATVTYLPLASHSILSQSVHTFVMTSDACSFLGSEREIIIFIFFQGQSQGENETVSDQGNFFPQRSIQSQLVAAKI